MVYDYIIIGAGSAGCVVANRLTDDASCSVLLLEAGGKSNFLTSIPGGYAKLHNSSVDWAFWTEPQPHVANRRLFIPRGKALGGCSTTNAMAYVRGNAYDYNQWAAMGNKGWGYNDILPYFKKSEHHEVFNDHYHNQGGLLNVSFSSHPSPLTKIFLKACAENGIAYNEDYNGQQQLGAGMLQYTIKNNQRHSTSSAFLQPIIKRSNLVVSTNVMVSKIIIEKERAIGVEVVTKGKSFEKIFCNREVILCAGAIQSPQLLMLSGIGEAAVLKTAGIEVMHALNGVGKNLHDHVWTYTGSACNISSANKDVKPLNQLKALAKYLLFKTGPLCNSPIEANAFLQTKPGLLQPDIQFHFAPFFPGTDYKTDLYNIKSFPTQNGFSIMAILLHPQSRGYISLQSKNPMAPPVIQPNFFMEQTDKITLLNGLKKAIEVMQAKAFQPVITGQCYPHTSTTETSLLNHIDKSLETLYHPVGTCKMGNDELAVVNDKLQVHGIKALRVIDASIMPTIVSGNTNAACIMIGEKGADLIKKSQR